MSPCDLRRVLRTTKLGSTFFMQCVDQMGNTRLRLEKLRGRGSHDRPTDEVVSSHSSSKLIRIGTKRLKIESNHVSLVDFIKAYINFLL